MTFADDIPWTVALCLAGTFSLLSYVWGCSQASMYRDQQFERLVGDDARQRSVLRLICQHLGVAFPDLWNDEPEPEPDRWQRLLKWIAARFRGPAEVEDWQPIPAPEPITPPVPDLPAELLEPRQESQPEAPTTQPIPVAPGPATQPSQAVIADDWKRQSEALYQQMLAEIRESK